MGTQRPGRVQEAIREEVAKIVLGELKDPRLGFITITKVEITPDLRYARIYFSVLGDEKAKLLALKGLNHAKNFIKSKLGDRVKLKFMPEIAFRIDNSFENTKHIYDLIERLKKERKEDEGSSRSDQEV